MQKCIQYAFILGILMTVSSCEELGTTNTPEETAKNLEGAWKCDEDSPIFKSTQHIYEVYISVSDISDDKVYISNFYQLGSNFEVLATISGNTIGIQPQTVDGYTVRGSGTISSNQKEIDWKYFVDDGSGVEDEVDATYTFKY